MPVSEFLVVQQSRDVLLKPGNDLGVGEEPFDACRVHVLGVLTRAAQFAVGAVAYQSEDQPQLSVLRGP